MMSPPTRLRPYPRASERVAHETWVAADRGDGWHIRIRAWRRALWQIEATCTGVLSLEGGEIHIRGRFSPTASSPS